MMDLEMSSITAIIQTNAILFTIGMIYVLITHNWKRKAQQTDGNEIYDEGGEFGDISYVSQLDQSFSVDYGATAPTMLPQRGDFRKRSRQQMKQLDITTISSYRPPPIPSGGHESRGNQGAHATGPASGSYLNSLNNQFLSRSSSVSSLGRGLSMAFGGNKRVVTPSEIGGDDLLEPLNRTVEGNGKPIDKDILLSRPKGWLQLFRILYETDEYEVLKNQNTDGYFYLLYLKNSFQLFLILSIWNCLVLLPAYTFLHNAKFHYNMANPKLLTSALDQLTIADSLMNPQVMSLGVIVCLLYTTIAYYVIMKSFGQKMGSFAFPPQQQYLDSFTQQHSIMIRGINQGISVDEANYVIRRLFEERFGKKQVIAVHTIRRTENALYLCNKKEHYKRMIDQYRMQNNFQEAQTRETITVSGLGGLKRLSVDAEKYYIDKLIKVSREWSLLKARSGNSNTGVAFVSFRDKGCVADTIDDIDILKSKVLGIEKYERVDVLNWDVDEAMPPSDIIWAELNKGSHLPFLMRVLLNLLLPLGLSAIGVFAILKLDLEYFWTHEDFLYGIIIKYASPLLLIFVSFNLIQRYLYQVSNRANSHERKSRKEDSIMSRSITYMMLCTLVIPIIAVCVYSMGQYDYTKENPADGVPKHPKKPNQQHKYQVLNTRIDNQYNEFFALTIAASEEFFMRYSLQFLILLFVTQLSFSPVNLLKALHFNGDNTQKFKYFAYFSLPFKIAVSVSFFAFSLFFSVFIPVLTPVSAFSFLVTYYIDKYNLIYVYPIDFESKVTNRKYLITYSIVAIVLFQFGVFVVASTVLTRRVSIYLFAFLVIQVMILFTTFEFIRKPWEGKEQDYERVINQQGANIFESISSMHTGDFGFGGGMPVSINDSQLNFRRSLASLGMNNPRPKQTAPPDAQVIENQKIEILNKAYENPFERLFHDNNVDENPHDTSQSQKQEEDSFLEQLSPPILAKELSTHRTIHQTKDQHVNLSNYFTVSPKDEKPMEIDNLKQVRSTPDSIRGQRRTSNMESRLSGMEDNERYSNHNRFKRSRQNTEEEGQLDAFRWSPQNSRFDKNSRAQRQGSLKINVKTKDDVPHFNPSKFGIQPQSSFKSSKLDLSLTMSQKQAFI